VMGTWRRAAGEIFLDWLAPSRGLRWIDVGCGSGAFTELLVERCAPMEIEGIDPSEAQLSFARARPVGQIAKFHRGDALALPFSDARFDAAVMALVIFFVLEPAAGVAEMARVVCPGGTVAAYVWDITTGGHPLDPMHNEMIAMGFTPPLPPRCDVTDLEALQRLWRGAALDASRHGRSRCSGRLLTSRTIGSPARSVQRLAKLLPPWFQVMSNFLKRECTGDSSQMRRGASPALAEQMQ